MTREDHRTKTDIEDLSEHRGICLEHSGMASKLNGGLALLTTILVLLGYQVFIQVPNLRLEMAEKIGRLDARATALERKDGEFEKDLTDVKTRLFSIEKSVPVK